MSWAPRSADQMASAIGFAVLAVDTPRSSMSCRLPMMIARKCKVVGDATVSWPMVSMRCDCRSRSSVTLRCGDVLLDRDVMGDLATAVATGAIDASSRTVRRSCYDC